MSRSERLLALLDAMRRHRRPVAASALASELGVSVRTLYRDVASLRAQGAPIEGEAGMGYVLGAGFLLPPLSFPPEELEALVLGSRWVASRGDARLRTAAESALARIAAVMPEARAGEAEDAGLFVGPATPARPDHVDPAILRQSIRAETKLEITYRDQRRAPTSRIVWPFAVAYFEEVRLLLAWCELRQDFRHFRTDRIDAATPLPDRYPVRRRTLHRRWRAANVGQDADRN